MRDWRLALGSTAIIFGHGETGTGNAMPMDESFRLASCRFVDGIVP